MATTGYDQYREDVAGRANVSDSPDLLAYYKRLEQIGTGALWTVANKIEPWEPVSTSLPMLWRYRDLREDVLRAEARLAARRVSSHARKSRNDSIRQFAIRVRFGWLAFSYCRAPNSTAFDAGSCAFTLVFLYDI